MFNKWLWYPLGFSIKYLAQINSARGGKWVAVNCREHRGAAFAALPLCCQSAALLPWRAPALHGAGLASCCSTELWLHNPTRSVKRTNNRNPKHLAPKTAKLLVGSRQKHPLEDSGVLLSSNNVFPQVDFLFQSNGLRKYLNWALYLVHYKNLNFLKCGCPRRTQLPGLQQPAVFLSVWEPPLIIRACRQWYPETCLVSRLAAVLTELILLRRAAYF